MARRPFVVIDPELPDREFQRLLANREILPTAGSAPAAPRWGGRTWADVRLALLQAPLWTYVPAAVGRHFGARVRAVAYAAQAGLVGAVIVYGGDALGFILTAGVPVQVAVFAALLMRCGEDEVTKLARRRHGHYIVSRDLTETDAGLLRRTVFAVVGVLHSQVHRAGLLDDVHNTVTLPRQAWEVGQTLAELSRLRAGHEQVRAGSVTPRVQAMLGPQERALALATDSVTRRVEALEAYALRTRSADAAFDEWRSVQVLAEHNDDFRDLLARTVRDELAIAEIEGLSDQARRIEEALRSSVAQARKAGLSLVPDLPGTTKAS